MHDHYHFKSDFILEFLLEDCFFDNDALKRFIWKFEETKIGEQLSQHVSLNLLLPVCNDVTDAHDLGHCVLT